MGRKTVGTVLGGGYSCSVPHQMLRRSPESEPRRVGVSQLWRGRRTRHAFPYTQAGLDTCKGAMEKLIELGSQVCSRKDVSSRKMPESFLPFPDCLYAWGWGWGCQEERCVLEQKYKSGRTVSLTTGPGKGFGSFFKWCNLVVKK